MDYTEYKEKYRKITKYTYDVMADLHYDTITCSNAAQRLEWYVFVAAELIIACLMQMLSMRLAWRNAN